MLDIINFVFPISAYMASSSRWGAYSDSADDGCLEKGYRCMDEDKLSSGHAMRTGLSKCGVILDAGVLGFWCEV